MQLRALAVVALAASSIACGKDSAGPAQTRVLLIVAAGDRQYGLAGATLQAPLQVVVVNAVSETPADDVRVDWRIVEGTGASLTAMSSTTDDEGIASTQLRLGSQVGAVRVEARSEQMVGQAATFTAHVVLMPVVTAVSPTTAAAGQTVTLTGSNFSPVPEENGVLFGGLRGRVLTASTTQLTVQVPACVPTRTLDLRVNLGAVASAPVTIQTAAAAGAPLQLARGEVRVFADAADYACLRLPPLTGHAYLVVPQNAADAAGVPMPFELRGIAEGGIVAAPPPAAHAAPAGATASDWELALRARERLLLGGGPDVLLEPDAALARVQIEIGERRDFNVLDRNNESVKITAEVTAISQRAIMYQDLEAPANGFTAADFDAFGALFDDPIYTTDVQVFGAPSDVDANGKIIILFTPRVNALTPASDESFIAGYFFGCDLVAATRCEKTNGAELFYSMVPDPDGRFSGRRTKSQVLRTVPGVLAHEFQHMINFARKDESLDALWLSEGLAHAAEDIVGDVFLARADTANAVDFKLPNFVRGNRYLGAVSTSSMVSAASPGTLELRGAAWLFVKYIAGHFGGHDLLGRLTRSDLSGSANVATETGQPWSRLFSDFSIALWADGAPELQGVSVDPRLSFIDFDLRRVLGQFQGGFPLRPQVLAYADFLVADALPAAASDHFLIQTTSLGPPTLGLTFAGAFGGPFTGLNAKGQIAILRVR
jgi:hypothetical protein